MRTESKTFVALFVAIGAIAASLGCYAHFIKSQTASLLADIRTLTAGRSTEFDVGQLTGRHMRYLTSRDCTHGISTTTFAVRNTWLSATKLEPPAWFRASVLVKDGLVFSISAELARSMDVYPTFQGSAGMVEEYVEFPDYLDRDQHYAFPTPVGKPYLRVLLDSHASPIQREHAFGFSLRCLVQLGSGCDLPCESAFRVARLGDGLRGSRII